MLLGYDVGSIHYWIVQWYDHQFGIACHWAHHLGRSLWSFYSAWTKWHLGFTCCWHFWQDWSWKYGYTWPTLWRYCFGILSYSVARILKFLFLGDFYLIGVQLLSAVIIATWSALYTYLLLTVSFFKIIISNANYYKSRQKLHNVFSDHW